MNKEILKNILLGVEKLMVMRNGPKSYKICILQKPLRFKKPIQIMQHSNKYKEY